MSTGDNNKSVNDNNAKRSRSKDNQHVKQHGKENVGVTNRGAVVNKKLSSSFLLLSPELRKNRSSSGGGGGKLREKSSGAACDYESPLLVNCEEDKSASLSYSKISNGSRSGGTGTVQGIAYASDSSVNSEEEKEMMGRRFLQFSNIKPTIHIFSPPTAPTNSHESPVTDRSENESLYLSHSTISNGCQDDDTAISHKSLVTVRFENESLSLNHSNISNGSHNSGKATAEFTDTSVDEPNASGNNETKKVESIQVANTKLKKRTFSQFEYPQDIPPPTANYIRLVYEEAMNESNCVGDDDEASTSPTKTETQLNHQQKLKIAGSNQISFEQVLVPCVIYRQREELAKIQGKAQGHDDQETKEKILLCRATLKAIERDATFAVKTCREEHEADVRTRRKEEEDQRRVAKEARKKDRIVKRKKRVEDRKREVEKKRMEEEERKRMEKAEAERRADRRKRERKKNFPKNKELWREVALLMTDLARLKKEKTIWKNAGSILDEMEDKSKQIINVMHIEKDQVDGADGVDNKNDAVSLQKTHQTAVHDITVSATRINDALGEVQTLVEKADTVRRELYTKYKTDHKFQGYLGIKNPKALIRALAL